MNDSRSQTKTSIRINQSEFAEVRKDEFTGERSLNSLKAFKANEIFSEFHWDIVHAKPEIFTVQIGDNKHIDLLPGFLECMNHSCNPNCFVDTEAKKIICLKAIKPGDEITFFYPSTEWDMDKPFECRCGSKNCLRTIKGAKYLSSAETGRYRFTDYIIRKINHQAHKIA